MSNFIFTGKVKPGGEYYWINLIAKKYSSDDDIASIDIFNELIEKYSDRVDNWVCLKSHDVIDNDYFTSTEYNNLIDVLKRTNQLDKFLLIDSDLNYTNTFKNELTYYKSMPLMIGENHQYIAMDYPAVLKHKPSKFVKKFLCLNGIERSHRTKLWDFFYKKNILDNVFLSFTPHEPWNDRCTIIDTEYDYPFNSQYGEFNYRHRNKISNLYNSSFCNIITETQFSSTSENSLQITEKTDKSLVTLQPFIMVSTDRTIQRLHEYGFKTFNNWWDESYDLEPDSSKRLDKIFKVIEHINSFSIEELTDMYIEMKPILIHNFKLSRKIWNDDNSYWHQKPVFDEIEITV